MVVIYMNVVRTIAIVEIFDIYVDGYEKIKDLSLILTGITIAQGIFVLDLF